MAMKMDRRAFLKTSAAMAVAVSMTGLLGGCSGGDDGVCVYCVGCHDIYGSANGIYIYRT